MATNPDSLYNVAAGLLQQAVDILTAADLQLPSHRFVSYHGPAWDCCDHLVVHFSQLRPTPATSRAQERGGNVIPGRVLEADLVLTLIGCAAIGDPIPSDDEIVDNAVTTYAYAWVLYHELSCMLNADALLPDFPGCKIVKLGNLQPHPPIGGCESMTITVTVQFS